MSLSGDILVRAGAQVNITAFWLPPPIRLLSVILTGMSKSRKCSKCGTEMTARPSARCQECNWPNEPFEFTERHWTFLGVGVLVLLAAVIAIQHILHSF